MKYYYNIVIPVATDGVYTYVSPVSIAPGCRVIIQLGSRNVPGICLEEVAKPCFECKEIITVLDTKNPLFNDKWMLLFKMVSGYYSSRLGATLYGIVSASLLSSNSKDNPESAKINSNEHEKIILNKEQSVIVDSINLDKYGAHLIHGVTGSGKTEVYLSLALKAFNNGFSILYLVPEVSLTTQLISRVKKRIGINPVVYHSKLSPKAHKNAFWEIAKANNVFIIGARSALFTPISNLGLIIIDEEHENTYKQEEIPSYNARDMAVYYAKIWDIPVVLGSATPSVESFYNSSINKYQLYTILHRNQGAKLPDIEILDVKEKSLVGNILCEEVYDSLYNTVSSDRQALIFLNRKGYSSALFCKSCGAVNECPNCSVPLTLYKDRSCLCQYCGMKLYKPKCAECGSLDFYDYGVGTEKVEEYIEQMFPGASIRLDADKITSIKKLTDSLNDFQEKKYKILLGTQIVSKGLHFPDVTLGCILGIDNILCLPDYRSNERAFQLLTQVSGRAGRGGSKGTVFIQTCMPEHPIFEIVRSNGKDFYEFELNKRKEYNYPPFVKLARIIIQHSNAVLVEKTAFYIKEKISATHPNALYLGPAPAGINKIKNKYRYSILIKVKNNNYLTDILLTAQSAFDIFKKENKAGSIAMKIDRDPYYFM